MWYEHRDFWFLERWTRYLHYWKLWYPAVGSDRSIDFKKCCILCYRVIIISFVRSTCRKKKRLYCFFIVFFVKGYMHRNWNTILHEKCCQKLFEESLEFTDVVKWTIYNSCFCRVLVIRVNLSLRRSFWFLRCFSSLSASLRSSSSLAGQNASKDSPSLKSDKSTHLSSLHATTTINFSFFSCSQYIFIWRTLYVEK